jgi:deoxyhypusine synthase
MLRTVAGRPTRVLAVPCRRQAGRPTRVLAVPCRYSSTINLLASSSSADEAQAVYHRGSHKILDITNATIDGGVDAVRAVAEELVGAMASAARSEGTNVLHTHIEAFDGSSSPPGFASVVLLDESHLSAHSYSDEGMLAIDVFTCGSDPSVADRIAGRVSQQVMQIWPAATIEHAGLRRFEQFDIPAYLQEYYSLSDSGSLRADNLALLEFLHEAYARVAASSGGAGAAAGLKVLELGGGPTIYQLLSASRFASEICFTDLLATNVRFAAQYTRAGDQTLGMHSTTPFDWSPYEQVVMELESKTTDTESTAPLERLSNVMQAFGTLDVSQPGAPLRPCGLSSSAVRPEQQFDVLSACFVFEASAVTGAGWGEHLKNGLSWLAPGGHLVATTLLNTTGVVTEGGRQLATPVLSTEMIRARLDALGLEEIHLEAIDSYTEEGPVQIATITARKPSAPSPLKSDTSAVARYVRHHFRHFNAATLIDAADGYRSHIEAGGAMWVSVAGAMSTAEIGISLADMIRQGKVHGLSVTGANLEEDFFNLVAHNSYTRIPDWRGLSKKDEQALYDAGLNRVTDTCIPEEEAFRRCERAMQELYLEARQSGERLAPHEIFYRLIRRGTLAHHYEIDPADSWLVAAAEAELPIVCPGWEDSTCGNIIVSLKLKGLIDDYPIQSGLEQMETLVDWYLEQDAAREAGVGFFQLGGGIAGDFSVCAVPLIRQDLERTGVGLWRYYAQVTDGTTSYGGYSACPPNEKISWGKLAPETPSFIIESDATIVWPLVTALVLDD